MCLAGQRPIIEEAPSYKWRFIRGASAVSLQIEGSNAVRSGRSMGKEFVRLELILMSNL